MKIAVLSGKGGTGKTLVSVNLAAVAKTAVYLDCDVEEPNAHLFFKPEAVRTEEVRVKIPQVEEASCSACRACVDFCKFNALAYIKDQLLVFEEVCHSCGGCLLVCPEKALTEKDKPIGQIQSGFSGGVSLHTGILNIGEASGVPLIHQLLSKYAPDSDQTTIIDCPPGSACVVMESIKDADYCILVAEPTLFGVHNLEMVYDLVSLFKKPLGVVLNKCLDDDNPAERFCIEKGIQILMKIPFDSELGRLNSNAEIAVFKNEHYHALFSSLLDKVKKEVRHETVTHS